MFGYIAIDARTLPEARRNRFRAFYCGLCAMLQSRHGLMGSATLSYDLTFLAVLLNALYEPEEQADSRRCLAHPMKRHDCVTSSVTAYAADMNVALAYHKCRDNWLDDRNIVSAAEGALLKSAYERVRRDWPECCCVIEQWLEEIHQIEQAEKYGVDPPANATGRMLGRLFVYPRDTAWADELRAVGNGLGQFIYMMDAYDDLPQDIRRGRYNPLKPLSECRREDYESFCRSALMMMIADATDAFERLPIVLDADILRNVLYSGVWCRYAYLQKKRNAASKGEK